MENQNGTSVGNTGTPDRIVWLIFAVLLLLSFIVYLPMFKVTPSGDDYVAPMAEILRGDRDGPGSFFIESQLQDYRPLQSLTMWIVGRIGTDKDSTYFLIHILHLISYWFFCFVGFLWIRKLNFNRYAVIVAGLVLFFHPVLTALVSGMDGFARLLVTAFMWLSAYFIFRDIQNNPVKAVLLAAILFTISLGFMEYAVALIPIAVGIILWTCKTKKLQRILVTLIPLIVIFAVYYLVRIDIVAKAEGASGFITLNPVTWIKNVVMMYSSVMYFGDITPVMLNMDIIHLAWFGVNVLLVFLVLLMGFIFYHRLGERKNANHLMILTLFIIACFPMVFMGDISEVYVNVLVVMIALLAGYAATGLLKSGHLFKYIALIILVFNIVISIFAIESKTKDLHDIGIRSKAMIDEIIASIPENAEGTEIAIVFTPPAYDPSVRYSNFAKDDAYLIHYKHGSFALDWYLPESKHLLSHEIVNDLSEVDQNQYDIVLLWDFDEKKFVKVKDLTE